MAKIPNKEKAVTPRFTGTEMKKLLRHCSTLAMRPATAVRHMVLDYMATHPMPDKE